MTKLRKQTHLEANLLQEKKDKHIIGWLRVGPYREKLTSGLKMLPSACGLEQHFQDLGHSLSLYGPPNRPITSIYSPKYEELSLAISGLSL